jgi:hypothetical protein
MNSAEAPHTIDRRMAVHALMQTAPTFIKTGIDERSASIHMQAAMPHVIRLVQEMRRRDADYARQALGAQASQRALNDPDRLIAMAVVLGRSAAALMTKDRQSMPGAAPRDGLPEAMEKVASIVPQLIRTFHGAEADMASFLKDQREADRKMGREPSHLPQSGIPSEAVRLLGHMVSGIVAGQIEAGLTADRAMDALAKTPAIRDELVRQALRTSRLDAELYPQTDAPALKQERLAVAGHELGVRVASVGQKAVRQKTLPSAADVRDVVLKGLEPMLRQASRLSLEEMSIKAGAVDGPLAEGRYAVSDRVRHRLLAQAVNNVVASHVRSDGYLNALPEQDGSKGDSPTGRTSSGPRRTLR